MHAVSTLSAGVVGWVGFFVSVVVFEMEIFAAWFQTILSFAQPSETGAWRP